MRYLTALLVIACTSDPLPQPEACLSPGRAYTEVFTRVEGDCPDLPPQALELTPEGTLPPGPGETCEEVRTEGCTTANYRCTYLTDTCKLVSSFEASFEADGTKGVGTVNATLTCDGGSWCSAIYRVDFEAVR